MPSITVKFSPWAPQPRNQKELKILLQENKELTVLSMVHGAGKTTTREELLKAGFDHVEVRYGNLGAKVWAGPL